MCAYSKAWNETLPDGTEASDTLDTLIQDLKVSIRERLEDTYPGWSSDGEDPKLFTVPTTTSLVYGNLPSERAAVSLSSSQSIVTATPTAVIWDTEDVDVGGLVDIGSQPTRITIVNAGFYLASTHIPWGSGSGGYRQISIRPNGSGIIARAFITTPLSGSADQQSVAYLGALAATDYLEVIVTHTQGANINVSTASDIPAFSIYRLI